MIRNAFLAGVFAALAIPRVYADFSYEQTAKMTGGAMAGMMKVAGAFSKQLREPMVSTVSVKGNRLVNASRDSLNIVDLDKETITDINLKDRTYSTVTFAEMTAAMQRMMEKMDKSAAQASANDANVKVDVKDTGQSKVVNGMQAKQYILTIDIEATDAKSGQSGALTTSSEMWFSPSVRGYEEVKAFYTRMGEKLAFTPSGLGLTMGRADLAKGMARAAKEMAKLDGIPVMTIMRMGPKLTPEQQAELAKAHQQQANQPPPPAASEAAGQAAGQAASSAALGRLGRGGAIGGALGGLGGFGRKKKQEQAQAPPPPQQAASTPPAADAQAVGGAGMLMEMTTEITGFSSAPVDDSKWTTSGLKEIEHPMKKNLR